MFIRFQYISPFSRLLQKHLYLRSIYTPVQLYLRIFRQVFPWSFNCTEYGSVQLFLTALRMVYLFVDNKLKIHVYHSQFIEAMKAGNILRLEISLKLSIC